LFFTNFNFTFVTQFIRCYVNIGTAKNIVNKNMCYQPITIKTPQGYRTVPCGKCLECLRKYQSDWSNRMYEELKAHNGKAVFFTLTYDEQNVPKNYLYYANASEYEIFRSPSDYGYNNTYIDPEDGKEKVLPTRKGERKHKSVDPDVEVKELGIDYRIVDFNIPRKEREKFRNQIQRIYGDYIRNISSDSFPSFNSVLDVNSVQDYTYDFDEYEGPHFMDTSVMEEQVIMLDLFDQTIEDEEDTPCSVIESCEKEIPHFRERPVMMFNSVRKKDVQDWIKRARQRRKRLADKTGEPEQKFSFFVTSEYGPRTLRPHYHGVLFGVTAKETNDMKMDWIRHHGRKISWDNVDLSKGDMSYCAKYCSKGFYEHPLCSKDFFYYKPTSIDDVNIRPYTEYHSKHYERCMEIFGIDAPIVDPTFHLVSKGLGVSWVADHTSLVEDFQDIDFKDSEATSSIKVAYTPPIPSSEDYDDYIENSLQMSKKDATILYDLTLLKNVGKEDEHIIKRKNQELKSKDYEECIERLFEKFHYYRTIKGEVIAYGVPKYYRTKILSDGLRSAFANYVQQVNVELYQEKLDSLRANFPDWEDSQIVSALEKQEIEDKFNRMRTIKQKLDKQYNKSKI